MGSLGLLGWGDRGYGDELFFGALVSIEVAVLGYVLALAAGTVIALSTLRPSGLRWRLWQVYASVMMGVPALLVAFLLYFGGSQLIAGLFAPLGFKVRIDVTPFAAGIAALALVYSAYLANLIRGAIRAVPRGQFEAAAMLLVPWRKTWTRVVAPQVVHLVLPGLTNMWIVVLKDTALISLVGLKEIIAQAKLASGSTKESFIFYIAAAAFFLAMNVLTAIVAGWIGGRTRIGARAARA